MKRIVTADKIVTIETTVEDREVSYDDILESVTIEHDDWTNDAPWENCDGWEHDARRESYHDHEGIRDSRGYARCSRGDNHIIEVDDDVIVNRWGCGGYPGCSKQVRAELIAQVKRNALDQLVEWYEDGWEYFNVSGEFKGYTDSIGDVDSYEYADQLRHEIAVNIADDMEKDGYIITDRPKPDNRSNAQIQRGCHKQMLESFIVHSR